MLELMRLEMRKFRIGPYIRAALIANIMILALLCLISFFGKVQEKMPLTDYGMAFAIIDTLTRATYIVFAAVLLSRIVIDEFRTAHSLLTMVMSALATSFLSLIPLYFGMRKHSVSATILSSLIVVMLVCQSIDGFSLYSIVAVPIGLALLGIAVAYMSIRHIEHADV